MFTTPCFIKKNTKELRNELENLGYHKFKYCRDEFESNDVLAVIEMDNGEPIYVYIAYQNLDNMEYIDCGTNETLFLAIAALRDDSDMNQWFICDKGLMGYGEDGLPKWLEFEGDWKFCDSNEFYAPINPYRWHKATIEELIEHFKKE